MAKYLDNDGLLYFWQKIKATFARLSSPAFTGTPTAPTAASGTSTTQLATTEFVANAVAASASGVTGVKGNSESSYRTGNVNLTAANVGAAPTSHASSATTYGTGTSGNYGHVKLSDATNGTAAAASGGTAATPKAVADALAAAKSYADDCRTFYGTCDTAASTAAKVVACSTFEELTEGATIHVKFDNSNSASNPTLNVNSTGAKGIKFSTGSSVTPGTTARESWYSGEVVTLTYDGTYWCINSKKDLGRTNEHVAPSTNSAVYLAGAYSPTFPGSAIEIDHLDINSAIYHDNGNLHVSRLNNIEFTGDANGMEIFDNTSRAVLSVPTPGYTLGPACVKSVDTSIASGSTSTNVPTSAAVASLVSSAIATAQTGAAMFKGTIGSSTSTATYTQSTLQSAAYKTGWYLVVNSAGTYVGHACGVGDVIYCVKDKGSSYSADDFTVVQNEIDAITNSEIDAIVAQ